jgi:putative PIN family toxin of toxin-antitoxin system
VRLVLDTNILVSGLIWGGVPRRLLDLARDGQATLFTSSVLLDELADVLARDKFQTMLATQGITPAFLMQRYGMLARLVTPQAIEHTVRDPDDDAIIATALAAQAEVIVSGDHDLLVLHPYKEIQILDPAQAMQMVQQQAG